jgi:RNA polymerase sigma-70 factor (ECF subfamily)
MHDDDRADAALLAAAAAGDSSAFGVLVRRHIRTATLFAAQLLGDADDAEDVVQDAFTIVYRNAGTFDAARPFPPWLFGVVRQLAQNRVRRERRRSHLLRLWRSEPAPVAPAPDEGVHARLDADAAARAVAQLPMMQRACFELVAMRDVPIADVAAMHQISESTVRQHVFRARAALRDAIGGDSKPAGTA